MMNVVLEKFAKRAVNRGGLLLFRGDIAIEVVEEARRTRLPVLGIDGIFVDEGRTRPSLDDSIDFSIGCCLGDVYGEAIKFLRRHANADLYFEIVLGDEASGQLSA